jgi:hypothetical protein
MEIMTEWSRTSNWEDKCGESDNLKEVGKEEERIIKTKIKREE